MYPADKFERFLELPTELQAEVAKNLSAVELMRLRQTSSALLHDPFLKKVLQQKISEESFLVCYERHTFWITAGKVFACGDNRKSQLGLGDSIDRYRFSPVAIPLTPGDSIQNVITTDSYTFFLSHAGHVFACGDNQEGQLGLGDTTTRHRPVRIQFPSLPATDKIVRIVTKQDVSLFLTATGRLFVCGRNIFGCLELSQEIKKQTVPAELHLPLLPGEQIKQMIAGVSTLYLTSHGRVFGSGYNYKGQLGMKRKHNTFQLAEITFPMAPGDYICQLVSPHSTFFITQFGHVFVCGDNSKKELGLGHDKSCYRPTELTFLFAYDTSDAFQRVIAAWGDTFFLTRKGCIFACGGNACNRLGIGDVDADSPQPVLFPSLAKTDHIAEIITGSLSTFFLSRQGRLFACGKNHDGQLALQDSTLRVVDNPTEVTFLQRLYPHDRIDKIYVNSNTTYFLTRQGLIFACGLNYHGQLGTGNKVNVPDPIQLQLPQPLFY